jgi:hypothetical protein
VLFGPRRTSHTYTNKYLFPFLLLHDPFLVDHFAVQFTLRLCFLLALQHLRTSLLPFFLHRNVLLLPCCALLRPLRCHRVVWPKTHQS